ncbi:hypothetical protein JCM10296v2_000937 [Rhodotorula toruloides]
MASDAREPTAVETNALRIFSLANQQTFFDFSKVAFDGRQGNLATATVPPASTTPTPSAAASPPSASPEGVRRSERQAILRAEAAAATAAAAAAAAAAAHYEPASSSDRDYLPSLDPPYEPSHAPSPRQADPSPDSLLSPPATKSCSLGKTRAPRASEYHLSGTITSFADGSEELAKFVADSLSSLYRLEGWHGPPSPTLPHGVHFGRTEKDVERYLANNPMERARFVLQAIMGIPSAVGEPSPTCWLDREISSSPRAGNGRAKTCVELWNEVKKDGLLMCELLSDLDTHARDKSSFSMASYIPPSPLPDPALSPTSASISRRRVRADLLTSGPTSHASLSPSSSAAPTLPATSTSRKTADASPSAASVGADAASVGADVGSSRLPPNAPKTTLEVPLSPEVGVGAVTRGVETLVLLEEAWGLSPQGQPALPFSALGANKQQLSLNVQQVACQFGGRILRQLKPSKDNPISSEAFLDAIRRTNDCQLLSTSVQTVPLWRDGQRLLKGKTLELHGEIAAYEVAFFLHQLADALGVEGSNRTEKVQNLIVRISQACYLHIVANSADTLAYQWLSQNSLPSSLSPRGLPPFFSSAPSASAPDGSSASTASPSPPTSFTFQTARSGIDSAGSPLGSERTSTRTASARPASTLVLPLSQDDGDEEANSSFHSISTANSLFETASDEDELGESPPPHSPRARSPARPTTTPEPLSATAPDIVSARSVTFGAYTYVRRAPSVGAGPAVTLQIGDFIASGGCGDVYSDDTGLLAIKVIAPEVASDDDEEEDPDDFSFREEEAHREGEALARVQGCAVVPRLYGVFERWDPEGRRWSITVMERIKGRTSEKKDVAEYRDKISSAVRLIHAYGITHEDIRRNNILLRDGEVFLIDFGRALLAPSIWQAELETKRLESLAIE